MFSSIVQGYAELSCVDCPPSAHTHSPSRMEPQAASDRAVSLSLSLCSAVHPRSVNDTTPPTALPLPPFLFSILISFISMDNYDNI